MRFSVPLPSRRFAFSLLEMVAATVLLVLMFAAVTSLLRGFATGRRAIDRMSNRRPPLQLLADQLRRDLVGARYVRQDSNGLRLVGTIAQDWTTRLPSGRRAEIVYSVVKVDRDLWLVRKEVHLDEMSTQRSRVEPIWRGVSGIELVILEEADVEGSQRPPGNPAPAGMRPAPARMQVVIRHQDGQRLLNLPVLHHWEDG